MSKKSLFVIACVTSFLLSVQVVTARWNPPSEVPREGFLEISNEVVAMPDIKLRETEDIFRIRALEMDWDVGGMVYERELSGEGVKPVPPILFGIAEASADHEPEKYKAVTLPMYAAMKPAPRVSLIQFRAGVHGYTSPEPGLPMGPFPAVAKLWYDAIMGGYHTDTAGSGR